MTSPHEMVNVRNEIVTGPGGKQILAEGPSGNVVELFQPAAREARHPLR
jgi:hypothetical protein